MEKCGSARRGCDAVETQSDDCAHSRRGFRDGQARTGNPRLLRGVVNGVSDSGSTTAAGRHELAVVMPVYNEEACIAEVVAKWLALLSSEGIDFRVFVLNDGSTDGTAQRLATLSDEPRLEVITKPNSGHGPTILQGYRRATAAAAWVFQCDSDDEMSPVHFPHLWRARHDYDALFGTRTGRIQSRGRRFISAVSRLTVRLVFGTGVDDVNTPYRLIRSPLLAEIIEQIPANTFAPNVIISGTLARHSARIHNRPVHHEHRRTGAVSIVKWKLWKSVARAFWQTLTCRPRLRERPPDHG